MTPKRKKLPFVPFAGLQHFFPWALLMCVVVLITLILYPNLVIPPKVYHVGDVADKDIKANRDFFIEDAAATAEKRHEAADSVLTVYDLDTGMADRIVQRIHAAFAMMRNVYASYPEKAVKPPAPQGPAAAAKPPASAPAATGEAPSAAPPAPPVSLETLLWEKKPLFESTLGIEVSKGGFRILMHESFSSVIDDYIIRILTEIYDNGVVSNKELLLREDDRGIVLRDISTKVETITRSLRPFYGLDQSRVMVRILGQPLLKDESYTLRSLIVDFCQRLITPNITLNRNETENRRRRAADAVKPILYQIKAGEMILREGERVTDSDLVKLRKAFSIGRPNALPASGLGAALLITCLLLAVYIPHFQPSSRFARHLNRNLLFVSVVLVGFLFLARVAAAVSNTLILNLPMNVAKNTLYWSLPVGSGAMLVCLFLGLEAAIPFAVVQAVGTAAVFQNNFGMFLYVLISGIPAAYWMQDCRERKVFMKAGVKLGLVNAVLVVAINTYLADIGDLKLFWDIGFAAMGGIAAGILTAGIAPIIESAFNYTTDIKLLELANLDRPILHQLMIEAPGTYHHSVVVGSMVEAAAAEIGANPLLAKVCGYYHDIGKIKKPLYFIENQSNGINKHDKLAPSMSKRILISHVKDGVEMARENRLGREIVDVIGQSHGTSLIQFFYNKAVRLSGGDAINQDDYRYPGPKPQTREAGLVMLADIAEAASRTLDNPTPSRIQGLVQGLINKVFSDGQLDNCELTLKDLHSIAKSFIKILNGIHHHRIDYPDKTGRTEGKPANGRSDRQPPGKPSDSHRDDSDQSDGHLKRLGLS